MLEASRGRTPVLESTKVIRLRVARLQAVLSRNMYSVQGLLALIRPDSGQVCHSLIVVSYWRPGSAHVQAASAICVPELAGLDRLVDRAVGPADQIPVLVVEHGVEEVVGDPDRVVGVLAGDGRVGLAIEIGRIAGSDQRRDLLLFVRFPGDELLDVRMVDIDEDHLGGPAGRATALDRAGCAVAHLQEAHQTRRSATTGERFAFAADAGEVGAGAGAIFEDAGLARQRSMMPPSPTRSSSTDWMKQACGGGWV